MRLDQISENLDEFALPDNSVTNPIDEETNGIPDIGDTIRTKKMQMEGKVESVQQKSPRYTEVLFRTGDGRLMKTPLENVTVVEKLADCDIVMEIKEERIDEISNELLAKYKATAGKDASEADKNGDYSRGNKRFGGIVKATKKQFDNDSKKRVKEEVDNFTADDIKRLETITDLAILKTQAKALVGKDTKRKMKPEKVAYFIDKIDGLENARSIIKLMYDLLLSGEGFGVVGGRNTMNQNSYRRRFGEETTDEGSMGGINRSAPAQDVSYEKVLDEVIDLWKKECLNELSVDKLRAYRHAASSPEVIRHAPLRKVAKHAQGSELAGQKIRTKTGDRTGMHQPDRGTFEADEMGDLVRAQTTQPKPGQVIDKKYNGWIIRYQLAPKTPGAPVQWMAWHEKKDPTTAQRGQAASPEEAFRDATGFINDGAGEERKYTSNHVTIDFNSHFSKQIVPHGEPFFAKIDDGFILVSNKPQEGFSKASPRVETEGSERFWAMPISAKEAEIQKLVPNGRYSLGSKEEIDPETSMFDIHFQSVTQSKNDRLHMTVPGFTVATPRGVNELYQGPFQGDPAKLAKSPKSSLQGQGNIRFSDLVKDVIDTHGVKWAFDYYVKKHGLPPRQFQIFAGLAPEPKNFKSEWNTRT